MLIGLFMQVFGRDGAGIFLSTDYAIEHQGRHKNEQAKVGPKGERIRRERNKFHRLVFNAGFHAGRCL